MYSAALLFIPVTLFKKTSILWNFTILQNVQLILMQVS